MKPVFEKVASENKTDVQMYTMDIEDNKDYAMSLGIKSIPSIKIFNEGKVVETKVGVLNEDHIKGLVNSLI
jgi:thioredoxin 1